MPGAAKAIAFRNLLIHGYARVDDAIVWQATAGPLRELLWAIRARLAEKDGGGWPPCLGRGGSYGNCMRCR
jgi:hypothetical protein